MNKSCRARYWSMPAVSSTSRMTAWPSTMNCFRSVVSAEVAERPRGPGAPYRASLSYALPPFFSGLRRAGGVWGDTHTNPQLDVSTTQKQNSRVGSYVSMYSPFTNRHVRAVLPTPPEPITAHCGERQRAVPLCVIADLISRSFGHVCYFGVVGAGAVPGRYELTLRIRIVPRSLPLLLLLSLLVGELCPFVRAR